MEHIKLFSTWLKIPKLIRACDEQQHWKELTYLYVQYDEFDSAATTIMNHSPEAWDQMQFKDLIVKVASVELYYKAVHFYLQEHPDLINDILNVHALRVDHHRVVDIMRKAGHIRLVKPYMVAVQSNNVSAVNEALSEIYVEEDYDRLHESIDLHDNFDQIGLAQKIEKHELLEMRRVAANIYKKAGRWKQSIPFSKKDNLYKDCMETCSQSGDRELSQHLLVFFIEQSCSLSGSERVFCILPLCLLRYHRPDVALELSWMNNMIDFAFPYLLQFIREYTGKVDELIKHKIETQNEEKTKENEEKEDIAQQNMYAQLLPLALPAPPMSGMGGGGYAPPITPPMGERGYGPPTTPPMGDLGMPPMPILACLQWVEVAPTDRLIQRRKFCLIECFYNYFKSLTHLCIGSTLSFMNARRTKRYASRDEDEVKRRRGVRHTTKMRRGDKKMCIYESICNEEEAFLETKRHASHNKKEERRRLKIYVRRKRGKKCVERRGGHENLHHHLGGLAAMPFSSPLTMKLSSLRYPPCRPLPLASISYFPPLSYIYYFTKVFFAKISTATLNISRATTLFSFNNNALKSLLPSMLTITTLTSTSFSPKSQISLICS
ncbi:hypothetical protein Fmac_031352 [Flemingia macrophylla]|uniref:Clathrin heavy chain n=1 Tax=Flemingia macrophylla TaxID=520843 RepID=A0ABD1L1V9_9FABA